MINSSGGAEFVIERCRRQMSGRRSELRLKRRLTCCIHALEPRCGEFKAHVALDLKLEIQFLCDPRINMTLFSF